MISRAKGLENKNRKIERNLLHFCAMGIFRFWHEEKIISLLDTTRGVQFEKPIRDIIRWNVDSKTTDCPRIVAFRNKVFKRSDISTTSFEKKKTKKK